MNNEEKILDALTELTRQVSSIRQSVAVIEKEHGYKLGTVLDSQIDCNRNMEDLKDRMAQVESKLGESVIIKVATK